LSIEIHCFLWIPSENEEPKKHQQGLTTKVCQQFVGQRTNEHLMIRTKKGPKKSTAKLVVEPVKRV
jgi:hypothetical protein